MIVRTIIYFELNDDAAEKNENFLQNGVLNHHLTEAQFTDAVKHLLEMQGVNKTLTDLLGSFKFVVLPFSEGQECGECTTAALADVLMDTLKTHPDYSYIRDAQHAIDVFLDNEPPLSEE